MQGRLSPKAYGAPPFSFLVPFLPFPPFFLLSSPFPLALSIPLPYSSLQIHLGGLGSAIRSPSGARGPKRILTHLRVLERTPWQHLSTSPTFPMAQNASFPTRFRRPWFYVAYTGAIGTCLLKATWLVPNPNPNLLKAELPKWSLTLP